MLSLRAQPARGGAAPAHAKAAVAPQVHRPASVIVATYASRSARTVAAAAAAAPASSSAPLLAAAAAATFQPRRQRLAVVAAAASTQEAPQAQAEVSSAPPAAADGSAASATPAKKRKRPFRKANWKKKTTIEKGEPKAPEPPGWWTAEEYTTVAGVYEELLRRCEAGDAAVGPLFRIFKLATSPEEARVALNAIAAVRTASMRKGDVERFNDKLSAAFVLMIKDADAPDVLAEALSRATELGLLCSSSAVNGLLKVWGGQGELAKIEEVLAAMPLGGIEYTTLTAYVIIRASIAAGQLDKAEYYAQAMREREVRISPSAERLLEAGRNGTAQLMQPQQ